MTAPPLPADTAVGRVALTVTDLDRAVADPDGIGVRLTVAET